MENNKLPEKDYGMALCFLVFFALPTLMWFAGC